MFRGRRDQIGQYFALAGFKSTRIRLLQIVLYIESL